jgi:hypothetical protein
MAQEANGQLQKSWRNRIDRQRRSGQTVAQFCQQEGVSTPNYYRWATNSFSVKAFIYTCAKMTT